MTRFGNEYNRYGLRTSVLLLLYTFEYFEDFEDTQMTFDIRVTVTVVISWNVALSGKVL